MNWVRENKFLTGFIAVLVVVGGALGWLVYSSWGAYSDATDQYTQQANELNRLQSLNPYPDTGNLVKFKAQKNSIIDATHDLATKLTAIVIPSEDLTPSAFQDRLRVALKDVTAEAGKASVKLPQDFSLDFKTYETSPPSVAAATPLGRQLAALHEAMDIFINEHVDAVTGFTRSQLPEERGGGPGGPGGPGGGGPNGQRRQGGRSGVQKYSFDVQFTAGQSSVQKVLNDFASSEKQFFITRTLVIANSDPKPVSKVDATAAPVPGATAAAPAESGSAATTGTAGETTDSTGTNLKFIVGTEKVNVAMRIEVVSFNPPEKATKPGAPAAPAAH